MTPLELKKTMSAGLLSFPITDFDAAGDFRADTYTNSCQSDGSGKTCSIA